MIAEDVIIDNMLYIVASVTALFKCTIAIKSKHKLISLYFS